MFTINRREKERELREADTYRNNATTIGDGVNPNSINLGATHLIKSAKKQDGQIDVMLEW